MGTIVAFEEDLMRNRMRNKPKKTVTYASVILQFSGEQRHEDPAHEHGSVTEDKTAASEDLHSL